MLLVTGGAGPNGFNLISAMAVRGKCVAMANGLGTAWTVGTRIRLSRKRELSDCTRSATTGAPPFKTTLSAAHGAIVYESKILVANRPER